MITKNSLNDHDLAFTTNISALQKNLPYRTYCVLRWFWSASRIPREVTMQRFWEIVCNSSLSSKCKK